MDLRQINADQEPVGGALIKPHKEAGQALVVVALMLVVLVSVMGLAIDMGYFRYMKRQLQTAADAGAVAGALEINSCGGSPGCGNLVDAAQKASTENGFTDGTSGVTVTVNNPPTTAGDPHSGDGKYVEVIVSQPEPTHFSNIFGVASTTLTARGEARMTSGNCVYTVQGNSDLVVASALNFQCGIVAEGDIDCNGGSITAPRIGIGTSGSLSLGCSTNPSPVHIATPTPRDPLAYLPKPSVPACGTSTTNPYTGSPVQLNITKSVTLNPGNYCGGIVIANGATVTFTGSTTDAYVLTSTSGTNGGLTVNGGTLTGSNVTFYNSGPQGSINFTDGTVNLAAPTSGTDQGILFFQDAGDTADAAFSGIASGSSLTGAYYFPNANLSFALSFDLGGNAAYTILVASKISFTGGSFTIKNDYSSLAGGSPVKDIAVLVE
jgi:Flp pilus assembly protein TadG